MKVGLSDGQLVVLHHSTGQWLPIGGPWNDDVLAFLAGGALARRQAASILSRNPTPTAPPQGLPFHYRRMRSATLASSGVPPTSQIRAWRDRRNRPATDPSAWRTISDMPAMAGGARVPQPHGDRELSVTLRLDATFAWPFADRDPDEALRAISGFVVVAEFTAHEPQRRPVPPASIWRKAPSEAHLLGVVLSPVVATPDEVIDRWPTIVGRVRLDGQLLSQDQLHHSAATLGEVVAEASDQTLEYGDLFPTAQLPPLPLPLGSDAPGVLALEIDGVATITTTLAQAD